MIKGSFEPKRIKGLRNKYLPLAIVMALLLFFFSSSAQYDSTKNRQSQTSYGFDVRNYKFGTIVIPNDTPRLALKDSGAIAYKGGLFWMYSGVYWRNIVSISNSAAPSDLIIYNENTEWVGTTNMSSGNFDYTFNPSLGFKSFNSGAFTNGQWVQFLDGSIHTATGYDTLRLKIRLVDTFSTITKFTFKFLNNSTSASSTVTMSSGQYNWDRTIISTYQDVKVPVSSIGFSGQFNKLFIAMDDENTDGFQIDNIRLTGSTNNTSVIALDSLMWQTIYKAYTDSLALAAAINLKADQTALEDSIARILEIFPLHADSLAGGIDLATQVTGLLSKLNIANADNWDSAYAYLSTSGVHIILRRLNGQSDTLTTRLTVITSGPCGPAYISTNLDTLYIPYCSSGGGGGNLANELISGGKVTWLHDYVYNVSAAVYKIDGVQYSSPSTDITLDPADVTDDRIDIFLLTTSGTAIDSTGTPSTPAVEPGYDANTQFKISFAFVGAGTTQPTITNEWISQENGPWTHSASAGTIVTNSTNNPYAGSMDIEGTSVANGQYVTMTAIAPITYANFNALSFLIRSKANFSTTKKLVFRFYNGSTPVGNSIPFGSGSYGFISTNTTTYQPITMDLSDFGAITGATVLRITQSNTSGTQGWYIDNIQLQNTTGSGVSNRTIVLTGDATGTGTDTIPVVLKTVNSNVGSFTNANITVNAKGLITAASNGTGGSGAGAVYAGSGLENVNDSTLKLADSVRTRLNTAQDDILLKLNKTDTTNKWVQDMYERNDSLFKVKNGTETFVMLKGGGSATVIQTHTSGATVTVSNTTTWLVVNPASVLAALTVTMPASPTDGQLVDISFGGTITTSDAAVVTSFLVVPNSGQGLIGTGTYGEVVTEDHVAYRYNSSLTKWFRN